MKNGAALAALLLVACHSESAPPAIQVADAWARATVVGQRSTAAYLTITNSGGEDRLVEVSSPLGSASVHSTTTDGGVMRMRAVEELEIPAHSTVALKPGATHVMVSGLNRPLEVGQGVVLELSFERSGRRRVTATVRPAGSDGVAI